ncbi:alpha/beta fold hydrolase [Salinarimonas soli]|uniref:alpha/beta fold hydrolase n=1 Tax=Salinarimonas soli TaxID=1638099 RepID=UPI001F0A88BC|nr:alpha/beta fold hydrolase [Salinarimonas soli]
MKVSPQGAGEKLLLIHGLGGSARSWSPILPALAAEREVLAVDLPGHGGTPAEAGSDTFRGLTDIVDAFLVREGLTGIDMAGSSMGARMVLELARRGHARAVVALDPGGFWRGWERTYFHTTIAASIRLVRGLRPVLPTVARHAASRTAFLAQLSAKPWSLSSELVAGELESLASTPTFDPLYRDLATGPEQQGPAAAGSGPVVIGWGRQDRLCLPRQAERAHAAFPGSRLHWFENCGHFPMWDQPDEAARLVLESTGQGRNGVAEMPHR